MWIWGKGRSQRKLGEWEEERRGRKKGGSDGLREREMKKRGENTEAQK